MKINRKTKIKIIAFFCAIAVVLISAIPLFDRHNDALILILFFGSFAAGAMFVRLIEDFKSINKGK